MLRLYGYFCFGYFVETGLRPVSKGVLFSADVQHFESVANLLFFLLSRKGLNICRKNEPLKLIYPVRD
mgnify:FL=1